MNDLVQVHHLEPMTTSEVIAEGVELDHASVIQLIRRYVGELQNFGEVAFEIRLKAQGIPTEFAWLNEQQSTFLIILIRNTPRCVEFKIALVKAFFALRDRLRAQQEETAPPILSRDPAHVADLTVSGWRTFRALLGVGRNSGLTLRDALRRANEATTRRIGINMLAEINAEDDLPPDPPNVLTRSLSSERRFAEEWINGELDLPVIPCLSTDLYSAYLLWCRANGESRPRTSAQFYSSIQHSSGWEKRKTRIYVSPTSAETIPKPVVYPPMAAMVERGTVRPTDASNVRWITDYCARFSAALHTDGGDK